MRRLVLLMTAAAPLLAGAGRYYEVEYPASPRAGELQMAVTYTLWMPENAGRVRAVIVHQHGCGAPAAKGGSTAAYDLHWQALARRWDAALLGAYYHQDDKQDCRLWSDPRNGSEQTFLRALDEFAAKTQHAEVKDAPWCLWGHSGGGFWIGIMEIRHPERVIASWHRSGAPSAEPDLPEALYGVPMVANTGVKEKEGRFEGAWSGSLVWFKRLRAKGAPIAFAPDPRTSHECGDSRYLAIPFFDACLAMRLPGRRDPVGKLTPVDQRGSWLGTLLTDRAVPAAQYRGNAAESVWLPDERVAKAWSEYVRTGAVEDTTPPPAPFAVAAKPAEGGGVEITWDANADLESGLQAFAIERDGAQIAQVPENPVGRFGRPLFQPMSYHDTPEAPLPAMRYVDAAAPKGAHTYRVIAVNSVGLRSAASGGARSGAHARQ